MPRFWGFHQCVIPYNELRHWEGRSFKFPTPIDPRMRIGDHVYLFWSDDELYGRGIIEDIGRAGSARLIPDKIAYPDRARKTNTCHVCVLPKGRILLE